MPQTQDMAPQPVTVYRHGADLSLCYPLVWNVTLEYTATHFNVSGKTHKSELCCYGGSRKLVSELAKARPDTGAIFVCIRHPTDCIGV